MVGLRRGGTVVAVPVAGWALATAGPPSPTGPAMVKVIPRVKANIMRHGRIEARLVVWCIGRSPDPLLAKVST